MGGPPLVVPSRVKVGGSDRNDEELMRETWMPEIAPRSMEISHKIRRSLTLRVLGILWLLILNYMLQLIAANLPPEIGRQLTNVCTVRFGTKELSSMFFEPCMVCGPRLLISTEASLLQSAVST